MKLDTLIRSSTARIPRAVFWWISANVIAFIVWFAIAWRIWPWPNYGYCDFPVGSWRFLFAGTPGLIWMIHVVLIIIVIVNAVRRRKIIGVIAVFATFIAWTALTRYDFNPDAIPGDGCYEGMDVPLPEKNG